MALLRRFNLTKTKINILKHLVAPVHNDKATEDIFNKIKQETTDDMPIAMENPFVKEKPKCLLCELDIDPDFKNVRLLSQFVSRYTGRVYGRHITGLCDYKQKLVEKEIRKARTAGLMAVCLKDPNYLEDPDLYDPTKPIKPHPY